VEATVLRCQRVGGCCVEKDCGWWWEEDEVDEKRFKLFRDQDFPGSQEQVPEGSSSQKQAGGGKCGDEAGRVGCNVK